MPGVLGVTVVTTPRVLLHCTRDCGRIERPAFPVPSEEEGRKFMQQLGRNARRDREAVCVHVIPAEAGIQYSEALVFKPKCRGVLDPRLRGDDDGGFAASSARLARP
jgi:hypothetical protein